MPQSQRFKELRKRLSELRRHLLPAKFSSTGSYSSREEDRARGYRLLAHAEIESYLEDQARKVVTERITAWKRNRTPSNLLLAFLACYHSGWVDYDDGNNKRIMELAKSRRKIKETVSEIVDQAQTQFIQNLQGNHGVREKNLKILILPTGVELNELDATWIADLDDFGKQRGEVAHNAKRGATGGINPQDEYNRIKNLLIGLKELDKKMQNI